MRSRLPYLLFCRIDDDGIPPPPLGPAYQRRFLGLVDLLRYGQVSLALALFKWRLLSLVSAASSVPKVLGIAAGAELAHYSFVLPSLGRIPEMRIFDLEIGPCWTHPAHRGQKLFQHAIRAISRDCAAEGRALWMICQSQNHPSAAAIAKSGFAMVSTARKRERRLRVLHRYELIDENRDGALGGQSLRDWRDTEEERVRYNNHAPTATDPRRWGVNAMPAELCPPYRLYHAEIERHSAPAARILDLCTGDGVHALPAATHGAAVVGVDIAERGLQAAQRAAIEHALPCTFVCARVGLLPFSDHAFDVVTCAGGLSYVDHDELFREVARVLRPGGALILVDSFDENPIYRLNRHAHWLRGNRSRATLNRVPNNRTIARLQAEFADVDVRYFGTLTFLVPLFRAFASPDRVEALLTRSDRWLWRFREMGFKIVVTAAAPSAKPVKEPHVRSNS